MGGRSFAKADPITGKPGVYTPRMPPAVYHALKADLVEALSRYFDHVHVPFEVPGKEDYGDIDIKIAIVDKNGSDAISKLDRQQLCEKVADFLGATKSMYHPTVDTLSFAIPLPVDLAAMIPTTNGDGDPPQDPHYQVDVAVSYDLMHYNYECALHAHGDWRDILSVALHPLGLVFFADGFALRIEEIQESRLDDTWRKCRVHLSNDPVRILTFLGLDTRPLDHDFKFETSEDIYLWLSTSWAFHRAPYELQKVNEKASSPPVEANPCLSNLTAAPVTTHCRKLLKRNRPMSTHFVLEWLPSHPAVGAHKPVSDRTTIMLEAVSFFGQEAEYHHVFGEFQVEAAERQFWTDVNAMLARHMEQAYPNDFLPADFQPGHPLPNVPRLRIDKAKRALRALRRFVRFELEMVTKQDVGDDGTLQIEAFECVPTTEGGENLVDLKNLFSWTAACTWLPQELLRWTEAQVDGLLQRERAREKAMALRKKVVKGVAV